MKFLQAFQSPVFIALEAATICSLILSGGPANVCLSATRKTWWKFLLIIRRRASISCATKIENIPLWPELNRTYLLQNIRTPQLLFHLEIYSNI